MTIDFFDSRQFEFPDSTRLLAAGKLSFTVDVEEWFQVGAFETTFGRSDWPNLESRAQFQTEMLLHLLATLKIKATFFSLGWVAKREPGLMRKIVEAGHELACHGLDHRRLFTMSREEFQQDLLEAKHALEDAGGCRVIGYRAPSFSLTPDVWWVYEELEKAKFRYSSSLYPVKTDHYGAATAPRRPFYPLEGFKILEIPLTVSDIGYKRVPASGGGYFRLFPFAMSRFLLNRGQVQAASPGIFYMHPWEIDPDQPYVKEAPLLSRIRHYVGQKKLPRKLKRLTKNFSCARMDEVYAPLFEESGRL